MRPWMRKVLGGAITDENLKNWFFYGLNAKEKLEFLAKLDPHNAEVPEQPEARELAARLREAMRGADDTVPSEPGSGEVIEGEYEDLGPNPK